LVRPCEERKKRLVPNTLLPLVLELVTLVVVKTRVLSQTHSLEMEVTGSEEYSVGEAEMKADMVCSTQSPSPLPCTAPTQNAISVPVS
jgi:hypothetical protein